MSHGVPGYVGTVRDSVRKNRCLKEWFLFFRLQRSFICTYMYACAVPVVRLSDFRLREGISVYSPKHSLVQGRDSLDPFPTPVFSFPTGVTTGWGLGPSPSVSCHTHTDPKYCRPTQRGPSHKYLLPRLVSRSSGRDSSVGTVALTLKRPGALVGGGTGYHSKVTQVWDS